MCVCVCVCVCVCARARARTCTHVVNNVCFHYIYDVNLSSSLQADYTLCAYSVIVIYSILLFFFAIAISIILARFGPLWVELINSHLHYNTLDYRQTDRQTTR